MRWWLVVMLAFASCSKSEDKAKTDTGVSSGEREARKIRTLFAGVITSFRNDLASGNIDAARDRLAEMTLARSPDLAAIAKHPALAASVNYKISGVSITNGLATANGTIEGPSGTARLALSATLAGGMWRISGITVDGTPVL